MAYGANTNWDNERAYLKALAAKGGGNAVWANAQLTELDKAQQSYTKPTSGGVDYSNLIHSAIGAGAGSEDVQNLLDKRVQKATTTPGLEGYAYDDVYRNALNYIQQQQAIEKQRAGDDLSRQLRSVYEGQSSAYAEALRQQQAALAAATQKAVSGLEAQRGTTEDAYKAYFRQAYLDRMNAQKNLDQKLAAQGINGGAAESTRLGLDTAYANAAAQLAQGRARDLEGIDQAITDARLSGDVEAAQAAAQAIQTQTDRYASVLSDLISRYDSQEAQRQAVELDAQQNRLTYARNVVSAMLANGNVPDDSLLAEAGLTREQAQALLPKVTASGSGGGYAAQPVTEGNIYQQLANEGAVDEATAYALLLGKGYNSTQAKTLAQYYATIFQNSAPAQQQTSEIEQDLTALRKDGATAAQLNAVINAAVNNGIIGGTEATRLRALFVGTSR